jgi:hypothetical protein
MASSKGGTVYIPWYATGFHGDELEAALVEIGEHALRYGATDWTVIRTRDDRYKFFQFATFEDPTDFERYWYGREFSDWRARHSSYYTVPLVYYWCDRFGGSVAEATVAAAANGE